jgi:opacity protein-like surface antigen
VPLITRTLLFLFCLILGMVSLTAQSPSDAPVSELQRKFLRMEQRALELSQRLSEMSGTEPIQLIERNESLEPIELETDAQLSYDELPGPTIEPLPLPVEETETELPTVYKSEVHRVVPTTQQRKGDYYLMPLIGFAISSSTNFSQDNLNDELDGEWGNSVGLSAGKRWDNWTANIRAAYQYTKNKNLDFKNSTNNKYRVHGIEESFALSCGGGYNISLNNRLSTYGLINGGLAWRRNNADVEIKWLNQWRDDPNSASESSLVFTYDFSMGLEYLFTQNYSVRLGYRLIGLTSNESFEGSFQHLIELGVGANF